MDDERAVGGEGVGAAVDELLALGDVPVVKDVGEEGDLGRGEGICEHVAGLKGEAVGDVVLLCEFGGDFEDFGSIENGGGEVGVFLEAGDGVDAGAAAYIEEVGGGGEVELVGEGGGDVFGAACECECEMARVGFVFHGGVESFAEDEGGSPGVFAPGVFFIGFGG